MSFDFKGAGMGWATLNRDCCNWYRTYWKEYLVIAALQLGASYLYLLIKSGDYKEIIRKLDDKVSVIAKKKES